MLDRRLFLAGLGAAVAAPALAATPPSTILTGRRADGSFAATALDAHGADLWHHRLPDRAHGVTPLPQGRVAIVARRPGWYVHGLDTATGRHLWTLTPPPGRHFQGHATVTPDGRHLLTTENAFDAEKGVIGVWSLTATPERLTEWDAGGIGPHDLTFRADGTLVVAIGGILTHPDLDRVKLNLDTMAPALTFLSPDGTLRNRISPPHHQLSTRHLATHGNQVAVSCQFEGPKTDFPPLLLHHHPTTGLHALPWPASHAKACRNYGGDNCFSADGRLLGLSAPRGNRLLLWQNGQFHGAAELPDVCALHPTPHGITAATGTGALAQVTAGGVAGVRESATAWDNHMAKV